jgi:hypothetical protein
VAVPSAATVMVMAPVAVPPKVTVVPSVTQKVAQIS